MLLILHLTLLLRKSLKGCGLNRTISCCGLLIRISLPLLDLLHWLLGLLLLLLLPLLLLQKHLLLPLLPILSIPLSSYKCSIQNGLLWQSLCHGTLQSCRIDLSVWITNGGENGLFQCLFSFHCEVEFVPLLLLLRLLRLSLGWLGGLMSLDLRLWLLVILRRHPTCRLLLLLPQLTRLMDSMRKPLLLLLLLLLLVSLYRLLLTRSR
mmetsp:Transcript_21131/g.31556  ORF Transcript_21131/g.31556 Transcript_21131/m.31556 type:complete len:208 (-) Transcript_21131:813-1436(-)